MRRLLFPIVFLCGVTAALAQGPTGDPFSKLRFLIGDWVADGPASAGTGHFEFTADVQGKVLIRHNHAEIPAAKPKPAVTHDDVMLIYNDGVVRATYVDSEGHVIRYKLAPGARARRPSSPSPARDPHLPPLLQEAAGWPPGRPVRARPAGKARRLQDLPGVDGQAEALNGTRFLNAAAGLGQAPVSRFGVD